MARSTVQIRISLSPAHAAALCVIAEHDAGGARADVSPVVAGLVRAELEKRWPGAWGKAVDALKNWRVDGSDPEEMVKVATATIVEHGQDRPTTAAEAADMFEALAKCK